MASDEATGTAATSLGEEAVKKAVTESGGTERGRVMKVLYVDDDGNTVGQWASQQIPENPFGARAMAGLIDPPYKLEQMVYMAEQHPVHSSAIEQKTVDVCGTGWDWVLPDDGDEANDSLPDEDPKAKATLNEWFESLAPDDESMQEVLSAGWDDVEVTGWGLLEVVRDPRGIARRLYHVPGHTVRAHKDGVRYVQRRGTNTIWFKKWGVTRPDGTEYTVDSKTGSYKNVNEPASDLLVVKKKSRRSTWYGIPGYVSAIGYLALALSARDDNILYFSNRREPRWAIVLSNLEDNPKIEDDIRRAFTVDLKQPHRNIIIPISGDGKIEFNQLSNKNGPQDGSFINLAEHCDKKILIGHRIPAERLANTTVGALGGNVADEANRVYKEGYVAPSQHLYETRLNRFIEVEYEVFKVGGKAEQEAEQEAQKRRRIIAKADSDEQTDTEAVTKYRLKFDDLDLDEDRAESEYATNLFKADAITLGEFRKRIGLGPLLKPKPNPPMEMKEGEAPEPEPITDPKTGEPMTDDSGKPVMKPAPPAPMVPAEEPLPPAGQVEPGEEVEMIESEYNYMLYSELPGVSRGGSGYAPQDLPGAQPEAAVAAKAGPEDAAKGRDLILMRLEMAELLRDGRETQAALARLAAKE